VTAESPQARGEKADVVVALPPRAARDLCAGIARKHSRVDGWRCEEEIKSLTHGARLDSARNEWRSRHSLFAPRMGTDL